MRRQYLHKENVKCYILLNEFLYLFFRIFSSIEKAHDDLQTIAKALRDKRANPSIEDPTK